MSKVVYRQMFAVFILPIFMAWPVTLIVTTALADNSSLESSTLNFNCITGSYNQESCSKESAAQLKAMGCELRNELPNIECVKLTDDTLCRLHSSNCIGATVLNKKYVCPDGFASSGAMSPECSDCAQAPHYAKNSKTIAMFANSYYCKKIGK